MSTTIRIETVGFPKVYPALAEVPLFEEAMLGALHSVIDPTLDRVRGRTPHIRIQAGYYTRDERGGDRVSVGIYNDAESYGVRHWKFQEYNTQPHWPPHGAGSRLDMWAKLHGKNTWYVAKRISEKGTIGNYIFSEEWDNAEPKIHTAVAEAQLAFLRRAIGTP